MKDIFQNNKCLRYLKISKYIENYIIIIYSLWRSILKIFIYFYLLTYFQILFSILKQFECKKKFIPKITMKYLICGKEILKIWDPS